MRQHQPVLAPPADAGAAQAYLSFTLGSETFALDIRQVREIIECGLLTEVPAMPEAIRGVINLRGAVVPVIDLAARFGRSRTELAQRTCIVILEMLASQASEDRQVLGILVDAVNEVLEIPADQIEPPPGFGSGLRSDFIAGMGRVGGRFVILLDLSRVLSFEELAHPAERALAESPRASAGTGLLAAPAS